MPKEGLLPPPLGLSEIQILLEKSQCGSLMAEKSLWCQAVELAGNLSSGMAGKAICSQRSISWEVFCYNALQRAAEGSLCLQRADDHSPRQKLGWPRELQEASTPDLGNKTLFLLQFLSSALYLLSSAQNLLLYQPAKEKY